MKTAYGGDVWLLGNEVALNNVCQRLSTCCCNCWKREPAHGAMSRAMDMLGPRG